MPAAYAISMTRPHEAFGLPKSLGRRLPRGIAAWNALFVGLSVVFAMFYIVQVNLSSSKSYELEHVQRHVDDLNTQMMITQEKIVTLSSMQSVNSRAMELGFTPVDRLQFLNPASKSYALAQ